MAGVKISSMIAAAVDRVEAQQRAERDEDVRAIIEFMEDELNNVRARCRGVAAASLQKLEEGNEAKCLTDTKKETSTRTKIARSRSDQAGAQRAHWHCHERRERGGKSYARLSTLLDRGWGRPTQPTETKHEGELNITMRNIMEGKK